MGLSPFDAPATFSMLSYTELAHGVWYPNGGMYSIVESLMGLARATGVTFRFNTSVARITTSAHRATGVTFADGSGNGADVVLANADLPYVYQRLSRRPNGEVNAPQGLLVFGDQLPVGRGPNVRAARPTYAVPRRRLSRQLPDDRPGSEPAYESERLPSRAGQARPIDGPAGPDTVAAIIPVGHLSDDGEQDWGELRDRARTQCSAG